MSARAMGPAGMERRRSERITLPPRGGAVSVVGARLVNVSAHGMLIESMLPMEPDQTLRLRMLIGGDKADVEARVACCSLLASGRRRLYGVGLEFTALPEAAREQLLAFVQASRETRASA